MGKSLIIKGADFSANGIHVDTVLTSVEKTNSMDEVLNVDISKAALDSVSSEVTGNKVKLLVSCSDAGANAILRGQTLTYRSAASGFPILGTGVWGSTFEIDYPQSAAVIIQSPQNLSGLEDKVFTISVVQ